MRKIVSKHGTWALCIIFGITGVVMHSWSYAEADESVERKMDKEASLPKTSSVLGSVVVNDVELILDKPCSYQWGHAAPLDITVRNRGKGLAAYYISGRPVCIRLSLFRKKNGDHQKKVEWVPVKRTEWGALYAPGGACEIGKLTYGMIPAGHETKFSVNIAKYFDLSKGGQYRLNVCLPMAVSSDNFISNTKAFNLECKGVAFSIDGECTLRKPPKYSSLTPDGMSFKRNIRRNTGHDHAKYYKTAPLTFQMTNTKKTQVQYVDTPLNGFEIVVEQDGKEVPLTRYGNSFFHNADAGKKPAINTMKPNGLVNAYFDLMRLYDMSVKGRYRMTIYWRRVGGKQIGSDHDKGQKLETIEFEVKE